MNNAIQRVEQADPAFWQPAGGQLARPLVSGLRRRMLTPTLSGRSATSVRCGVNPVARLIQYSYDDHTNLPFSVHRLNTK